MSAAAYRTLIDGPAGAIEIAVDVPAAPTGLALVAHPHPLFGGTLDNKVVTTLSRTLKELGYITLRPNFRGVGASVGTHDHGMGETDDLLAVVAWARGEFDPQSSLPLVLAGFSFGAFVQTRVGAALTRAATPPSRMILVGTAAGQVTGARSYTTENVPADSLVIHGENDDTVPLTNVLDWARPQDLPVVLVPGADHFFHGRLHIIKQLVIQALSARVAG